MPASTKRQRANHTFAILVALAAGEQTGSEIQSQILVDTIGAYVRPSSLYDALPRLLQLGLIAADGKRFHLTANGWRQLQHETKRYGQLVKQANIRIIASGHGRL